MCACLCVVCCNLNKTYRYFEDLMKYKSGNAKIEHLNIKRGWKIILKFAEVQ